jgi:TatD DNase family protein
VIDSHCHLDNPQFDNDRERTIDRAHEAGVTWMVAIGTGDGPPDLEAGIRLADRHSRFLATVGVHPHDAAKAGPETYKNLETLAGHPKVVGIGEIGLDYHYDFAPRDTQRGAFVDQLALAASARKPVVIHTREAWDDTFAILEQHWTPHGLPGILHCFTGGPAEAERAVKLGFSLAFGGVVTYPKSDTVREAARLAPLDRILLETDAPYLAPVPKRGKRNEPAFVAFTAAELARVRGIEIAELVAATTANFRRLAQVALPSAALDC